MLPMTPLEGDPGVGAVGAAGDEGVAGEVTLPERVTLAFKRIAPKVGESTGVPMPTMEMVVGVGAVVGNVDPELRTVGLDDVGGAGAAGAVDFEADAKARRRKADEESCRRGC